MTAERELINVGDAADVASRRPLVIAHRGGVVGPGTPECSLAAIRLAAEQGYDMVEFDVQETADGVPVVFHDSR
jgi:glycerophosphoryl diester phosphodiesterase